MVNIVNNTPAKWSARQRVTVGTPARSMSELFVVRKHRMAFASPTHAVSFAPPLSYGGESQTKLAVNRVHVKSYICGRMSVAHTHTHTHTLVLWVSGSSRFWLSDSLALVSFSDCTVDQKVQVNQCAAESCMDESYFVIHWWNRECLEKISRQIGPCVSALFSLPSRSPPLVMQSENALVHLAYLFIRHHPVCIQLLQLCQLVHVLASCPHHSDRNLWIHQQ